MCDLLKYVITNKAKVHYCVQSMLVLTVNAIKSLICVKQNWTTMVRQNLQYVSKLQITHCTEPLL